MESSHIVSIIAAVVAAVVTVVFIRMKAKKDSENKKDS